MRSSTLLLPALVAALALAACDRRAPGAESSPAAGSTVQATPSTAASSTPLPVSPSGLTNSSTASQGHDLSNSTRASGGSNVYQPPSADNPAANGAAAAAPASGASQSVTSQSRGTNAPPNDGTLPIGTEGNTGSRRGGGKG